MAVALSTSRFLLFVCIFTVASVTKIYASEPKFVSLASLCPELRVKANYAINDNFMGVAVNGYEVKESWLLETPAKKLCEANRYFMQKGFRILVHDGYRPQRAVNHFVKWAKSPEDNLALKKKYYPSLERTQLFPLGYIAQKSGHSRGSTVDIGLVRIDDDKEVDFGTEFDFFDERSHTFHAGLSEAQFKHRSILVEGMKKFGFKNYEKEWWHYTLIDEEYKDEYFDLPIK